MLPKPLATAIIVIVTIVWAINFGAQFIVTDYSPDVAINGIFMAVVGGALALSRRDNKNGEDPSPNEDEDADSGPVKAK